MWLVALILIAVVLFIQVATLLPLAGRQRLAWRHMSKRQRGWLWVIGVALPVLGVGVAWLLSRLSSTDAAYLFLAVVAVAAAVFLLVIPIVGARRRR